MFKLKTCLKCFFVIFAISISLAFSNTFQGYTLGRLACPGGIFGNAAVNPANIGSGFYVINKYQLGPLFALSKDSISFGIGVLDSVTSQKIKAQMLVLYSMPLKGKASNTKDYKLLDAIVGVNLLFHPKFNLGIRLGYSKDFNSKFSAFNKFALGASFYPVQKLKISTLFDNIEADNVSLNLGIKYSFSSFDIELDFEDFMLKMKSYKPYISLSSEIHLQNGFDIAPVFGYHLADSTKVLGLGFKMTQNDFNLQLGSKLFWLKNNSVLYNISCVAGFYF